MGKAARLAVWVPSAAMRPVFFFFLLKLFFEALFLLLALFFLFGAFFLLFFFFLAFFFLAFFFFAQLVLPFFFGAFLFQAQFFLALLLELALALLFFFFLLAGDVGFAGVRLGSRGPGFGFRRRLRFGPGFWRGLGPGLRGGAHGAGGGLLHAGSPDFGFDGFALLFAAPPAHAEQREHKQQRHVCANGPGQGGEQAGFGRRGEFGRVCGGRVHVGHGGPCLVAAEKGRAYFTESAMRCTPASRRRPMRLMTCW